MRGCRAALRRAALLHGTLLLGTLLLGAASAQAASLRYCDRPVPQTAAQQDRLLRLAATLKSLLDASGQPAALVSRSGLDLARFDVRYSHAGISLRDSPNAPWSVRQLYFACDEGRSRLFDQGIAGFLLGMDDAAIGHVSIVFMPAPEAAALARAALDKRLALQLLGAEYSANAYPFDARYQNCNQWVAELLAAAWGTTVAADGDPRRSAQRWLQQHGYAPHRFTPGPLMALSAFVPWLHNDDHPREDLSQGEYRVSMPAEIEAWLRARVPGTTRVELCHDARQIVIHRGWAPLGAGCEAGAGDEVIALGS